jgi:hypothetical protein
MFVYTDTDQNKNRAGGLFLLHHVEHLIVFQSQTHVCWDSDEETLRKSKQSA